MTEKKRGRPPRKGRKFVKISMNVDYDLYEIIQCIAEHTGFPMSRVANMMIRTMFKSSTNIKLF